MLPERINATEAMTVEMKKRILLIEESVYLFVIGKEVVVVVDDKNEKSLEQGPIYMFSIKPFLFSLPRSSACSLVLLCLHDPLNVAGNYEVINVGLSAYFPLPRFKYRIS